MSKGKRYDGEPKLNMKKVFGVIIAFAVLIMIITSIAKMLKSDKNEGAITATTYFSAYTNGKWGIINNKGEKVIDTQYDEIIVVPNKNKAVFLCTYDINDETGEYKTKAVNEKNTEIYKGYDKIEVIDNYDSKQNIWIEENVLRVQKNGKYGLIDLEGKQVLECKYDNIYSLKSVNDNLIVELDGKLGLVNSKGQIIIDAKYTKINILKEGYKDAYLVKDENGLYGVINTAGEVILEQKYQDIKYISSPTVYMAKEEETIKLVDSNGTVLQTSEGEEYVFTKGENVITKKDEKYGLETLQGESVIPYDYENLSYAFSIYYIAKKDGKYGIINVNNEVVKDFEYLNMYLLESGNFIVADKTETETEILDSNLAIRISGIVSEINTEKGYIKVYSEGNYKYYNFKFEEKQNTEILNRKNTIFKQKRRQIWLLR